MNRRSFFKKSSGLAVTAAIASQIKELPKVEAAPISSPKVPLLTSESQRCELHSNNWSCAQCPTNEIVGYTGVIDYGLSCADGTFHSLIFKDGMVVDSKISTSYPDDDYNPFSRERE